MINRLTSWLKTRLGYYKTNGATYYQFRIGRRTVAVSINDGRRVSGAVEEVE